MASDLRAATAGRRPKWQSWKSIAVAATVLVAAITIALSKHTNSVETAVATGTAAPINEPIAPQEVQLDLRIQPLGKPGNSLAFNDEVDHVQANDRLQINTQVPKSGYLYVVWYRPDGEVRLLDDKALTTQRMAIQEPPVDDKTPWEALGEKGTGKHLVIAFTKPTPLNAEEAEQLKHANWQTATDWLGQRPLFRTGHPRTRIDGPTRGGATSRTPSEAETDRYLGELGTMLKYKWGCYYQATLFRVNQD
jgi:hypothetical protein